MDEFFRNAINITKKLDSQPSSKQHRKSSGKQLHVSTVTKIIILIGVKIPRHNCPGLRHLRQGILSIVLAWLRKSFFVGEQGHLSFYTVVPDIGSDVKSPAIHIFRLVRKCHERRKNWRKMYLCNQQSKITPTTI